MKFPILAIMFLIFMTLKLCSVIDWSWWWVTAPLWGGLAVIGGFLLVTLVIAILSEMKGRR